MGHSSRHPRDVSRTEFEVAINEWIVGKNAERNRNLIHRRLIDGVCFEPLAEEFDMSVSQVNRIVQKSMEIIFRHIK